MNRKNIDMLTAKLQTLGCEPSVKERLAVYMCFAPEQFEIGDTFKLPDGDCNFFVHCTKGDQRLYDAVYYTAVLRRRPAVPAGLEALDGLMGSIDWAALYGAREHAVEGIVQIAERASDLVLQLRDVDVSGDLRFRYWVGTSLEAMIPNVSMLKAQHELSQRFYLLPDQPPIRFDDACRFLQSRWMEKKINSDRKLLVKNDRATPPATGAKGGKLLTKRTKANRKPGIFNR